MIKAFFKQCKSLPFPGRLLIAVVFVLPFERLPSLEAKIGPSQLTIKLSLIIGILFLISLLATHPQKQWSKKINYRSLKSHLALPILLTAYSLLSILWVENTAYWLHANLVQGFVITLFYGIYFTVKLSPNPKILARLILKTLIASTGAVLAFGIFQWTGDLLGLSPHLTFIRPEYATQRLGLPRMHSTFLEPLYFGLFLLLPLSILFADRSNVIFPRFWRTNLKPIYARFFIIGLIYVCILLSLARGAIAASALIGIIGFVYNFKVIKTTFKLKDYAQLFGIAALAFAALILITGQFGQKGIDKENDYKPGFSTIVEHLKTTKIFGSRADIEQTNSIGERQIAREQALRVVELSSRNLILGVGPGQYGEQFTDPKGFGETSNFMLLDVLVEYGLIGLAMILIFLIGTFRQLVSVVRITKNINTKVITTAAILFIFGYLVQSISFGELAITHFWVFIAIALATSQEATT